MARRLESVRSDVKRHRYFARYVKLMRDLGHFPAPPEISGSSIGPEVRLDGRYWLSFGSNNYLGLAEDARVTEAVAQVVRQVGLGPGGARLVSGTVETQVELEATLAEAFEYEDAMTFSSGYMANLGLIRALIDPFPYHRMARDRPGIIFSDELNHASIIDGIRLASAPVVRYGHSDMEDLQRGLEAHRDVRRKLIVTDGVFSMDGDLADLSSIVELAERHDALVYVDDAHGAGVLGDGGRGTAEHLGVGEHIDVLVGSFAKAFGAHGGFATSGHELIDYARTTTRSYIFANPIPPASAAGLITATGLVAAADDRRAALRSRSQLLREGLAEVGLTVLGGETPIVPLWLGDESLAHEFSSRLVDRGILVPCITQPAVPIDGARLRFSVMATHSVDQVAHVVDACGEIAAETGLT